MKKTLLLLVGTSALMLSCINDTKRQVNNAVPAGCLVIINDAYLGTYIEVVEAYKCA